MENYKQIAKEASVSVESVRELMARACVKGLRRPTIALPKMGVRWMRLRCFTPFTLIIVAPPSYWELGTLSRKR